MRDKFNLSEHRIQDKYAFDSGGWIYTEEYVKEFIKILKEEILKPANKGGLLMPTEADMKHKQIDIHLQGWVEALTSSCELIDKLAGDKLI